MEQTHLSAQVGHHITDRRSMCREELWLCWTSALGVEWDMSLRLASADHTSGNYKYNVKCYQNKKIQGVKRGKYNDKLKLLQNFSPKLLTHAIM